MRLVIVFAWSAPYSFDAFQRWAGRDHVLVQSWLPATQLVIRAVAAAGGGPVAARVAMAVVGALAVAAGAALARRFGGGAAGWAFVAGATFGPFVNWSTTFYQEGTFLLVFFVAALLASQGRLVLADLAMGALALVRYEGWPLVAFYVAWRRDLRALVALWGAAGWLGARAAFDLQGYAASPADFDDWEGLGARFSAVTWLEDAWRFVRLMWFTGGVGISVAAVIGVVTALRRRTPGVVLLGGAVVLQAVAIAGWLAGLEVATHRMLVIPVILALVLGSAGFARAWELATAPWMRGVLVLALGAQATVGLWEAWREGRSETSRTEPERFVISTIEELGGTWWVAPRRELGTRSRHDGCEVVQGASELRHGVDFWCAAWVPAEERAALRASCAGEIVWTKGGYEVRERSPEEVAEPALPPPG